MTASERRTSEVLSWALWLVGSFLLGWWAADDLAARWWVAAFVFLFGGSFRLLIASLGGGERG